MSGTTESSTVKFTTKDLNHAAFMWCQPGAKIVDVAKKDRNARPIFFTIELPLTAPQLQELLYSYANGQSVVEPKTYANKQNDLRDLLHNYRDKHA